MEYLRGSFSVGGVPSAKYRDNFDRVFAKSSKSAAKRKTARKTSSKRTTR